MDVKKLTKPERDKLLHILIHLTSINELAWRRSSKVPVSYSAYLGETRYEGRPPVRVTISPTKYTDGSVYYGYLSLGDAQFTHHQFDWELYKKLLREISLQLKKYREGEAARANEVVESLFTKWNSRG